MTTCTTEFEELLERIRGGDESAMADLLEMYSPALRRAARLLIGAPLRRLVDSVDLVQSINIILLKGMRQHTMDISSPAKLLALAQALIRRRIARHWRRHKSQLLASDPGNGHAANTQAAAVLHQALEVNETLAGLEDIDRRLVLLRLNGHSTADAARALDMDPAFLRVRLGRLRKKLRDQGLFAEYF